MISRRPVGWLGFVVWIGFPLGGCEHTHTLDEIEGLGRDGGGDVADDASSESPEDARARRMDAADRVADAGQSGGEDAGAPMACDGPPAIGGGRDYIEQRKCNGEPTYCEPPDGATVVSDADGLRAALQAAGAGDVVYVAGDATIDATGEDTFEIPAGVTLASNRGCDGAEGGRIRSDDAGTMLATGGPDVTVFGLRLRGYGSSERPHPRSSPNATGVRIRHDNASVGNTEVSNFVYMCVLVHEGGTNSRIHHNEITFCNKPGYGYGIAVYHEVALIEYNFIDDYRHAIAVGGSLYVDEKGYGGYVARYNIAGANRLNHVFDVHGSERDGFCGQWCGGVAGEKIEIHHNTFLPGDKYNSEYRSQAHVEIRGVPMETAEIYNNWFKGNVLTDYKVVQMDTHGPPYTSERYDNIEFRDNHFEESKPPSCDIGAPREDC